MNALTQAVRHWARDVAAAWNDFWFAPADPHTLAAIRICGGLMIFYTHLVWAKDLLAFLGPHGWLPIETSRLLHADVDGPRFVWTYLWHVESPALLWTLHIAGLIVMAMLVLGLFSRVTAVLTWFITISYCHRLQGALFGLDQVNAMVAMYLMVGRCGDAFSLDRWLARRKNVGPLLPPAPRVSTNIAIRLLQVHMAVIYLFGGISKLRGTAWWDGSAAWFSIANSEYQSLDLTWLVQYRWLIALLTHVTVFWETFYPVLIWPRVTRPVMLGMAVCVHGGIALFLGMPTFGLAMLIGNLAFISPNVVSGVVATVLQFARSPADPAVSEAITTTAKPAPARARRNRSTQPS